ncbi:MAG: alpha/beta fold hydrolase [Bdellovibrio sp.]|jgi:alpha-beta hydrolase superfamily lysophospholipase
MLKRSEGFFEGVHQTKLYFQSWLPETPIKGLLVITHGQGEHSDCYHRLIEALAPMGWGFLLWDLRGHGRSHGQRGYVSSFSDYTRDFELLSRQVVPRFTGAYPLVYFAHSMGALVQLSALGSIQDGNLKPQILSSPFLGLALQVPAVKEIGALFVRQLIPRLTLSNEIKNEDLSSDPEVLHEYERDTLRHKKISSGAYLGALECTQNILARPMIWRGRMLFLLADHDRVVSTRTNLNFIEGLSHANIEYQVFTNRKHELVNDLGRDEVFAKIRAFLLETPQAS